MINNVLKQMIALPAISNNSDIFTADSQRRTRQTEMTHFPNYEKHLPKLAALKIQFSPRLSDVDIPSSDGRGEGVLANKSERR